MLEKLGVRMYYFFIRHFFAGWFLLIIKKYGGVIKII